MSHASSSLPQVPVRRLLSIDVGIRHLGVCLFERSAPTWRVALWDVLDLTADAATAASVASEASCDHPGCAFRATYRRVRGERGKWCTRHARAQGTLLPEAWQTDGRGKKTPLAKRTLGDLKALVPPSEACSSRAKDAWLQRATEVAERTYLVPTAWGRANATAVPLATVGVSVRDWFYRVFASVQDVDVVLLENQLGKTSGGAETGGANPAVAVRMKTLQGMLTQACLMMPAWHVRDVQFLQASAKLSDQPAALRDTYAKRKRLSKQVAEEWLRHMPSLAEWGPTFRAHPKQDDLADAFLQAIWYIRRHRTFDHVDPPHPTKFVQPTTHHDTQAPSKSVVARDTVSLLSSSEDEEGEDEEGEDEEGEDGRCVEPRRL